MNTDEGIRASVGQGRLRVWGEAVEVGDDLVAWVAGGTRAHVGAVAVAALRPSLADAGRLSFTPSLITLAGHKEDTLALEGAAVLSKVTQRTVVLTVGIHIDDATGAELAALVQNARDVIKDLADRTPRPARQGSASNVQPH